MPIVATIDAGPGAPWVSETFARLLGPTPSRESANSRRAQPTRQASAQPNALTAVPSVMIVPTHDPTNFVPSSPSSEDEAPNAATPCASVPNPIISTAVTKMKYTPPKIATPRIARGMSRRGFFASSPSVAAASNPANDRNPNTTPRNRMEGDTPDGTVNMFNVKLVLVGAVPAITLISTTAQTIRISATVVPSTYSRNRVAWRMGRSARPSTPSKRIPPTRNPAQSGWLFHTPMSSRNAAPKMPAAIDVTTP